MNNLCIQLSKTTGNSVVTIKFNDNIFFNDIIKEDNYIVNYNFSNIHNDNILSLYTNSLTDSVKLDAISINDMNLLDIIYKEGYYYDIPDLKFEGILTKQELLLDISTPIHLSMLYWIGIYRGKIR